jgi:AcrR family transcriptional regulator
MTKTPKLRADAARNRDKLLSAAVALFAEQGPDVSLEAVARCAGVGIGTLYRHFPTRDALLEAAYRNEVTQLSDAADELLAQHPADEALALWMDRFVDYATTKRGIGPALKAMVSSSDLFADARRMNVGAIERLLDAGAAQGTIRADVSAEDVLHAMGAIWALGNDGWDDHARRLLRLIMDGLRYGASRVASR